ncbi:MAG: hypothetical protein IIC02_03175, partial [Planctomycetes bacterium]|nr:hypothetical protein [Planctomycetota bacterium]
MNEQFVRELTANQSRLLAYVLTLLPDYEAAQDVAQNTNVVLWRKADTFREGTQFMTWACQVARLEVLAYFRDQGRDRRRQLRRAAQRKNLHIQSQQERRAIVAR